jgi:hypothetical protein
MPTIKSEKFKAIEWIGEETLLFFFGISLLLVVTSVPLLFMQLSLLAREKTALQIIGTHLLVFTHTRNIGTRSS